MNRGNLIEKACGFLDGVPKGTDVESAMADFHIAMSAERDAEIADRLEVMQCLPGDTFDFLHAYEALIEELRGTK